MQFHCCSPHLTIFKTNFDYFFLFQIRLTNWKSRRQLASKKRKRRNINLLSWVRIFFVIFLKAMDLLPKISFIQDVMVAKFQKVFSIFFHFQKKGDSNQLISIVNFSILLHNFGYEFCWLLWRWNVIENAFIFWDLATFTRINLIGHHQHRKQQYRLPCPGLRFPLAVWSSY